MTDYDEFSDGRLSKLVAEKIMGWTIKNPPYTHWEKDGVYKANCITSDCVDCGTDFEPWNPAVDWNEAMQVRDHVHQEYIFSERMKFNEILQHLVTPKNLLLMGNLVSWPDGWMLIKPRDICIAALMVKDSEK